MHLNEASHSNNTSQMRKCKVIMTCDEYPSGSINTKSMQAGTFLRKHHHYNGRHSHVPAAFLYPNPHPSLPPSVHHLVKSSPFLSFGTEARVLSPLFNTLACQPSFHSPLASSPLFSQLTPPERAVSSPLSINLFFFSFFSVVPLCIFLQRNACLWFIHPARPSGLLLNALQSWMSIKAGPFASFSLFGWHHCRLCQGSCSVNSKHQNEMDEMAFHQL